jgi:electron transfer flavoprotein alpha subunit
MTDDAVDVWAYLQHSKAGLTKDSLELLAAGRKVADKLGQRVVGVILGYDVAILAEKAIQCGADDVLLIDSPSFETYFNLEYADAVYSLLAERRPYAFLFSANEIGKDLAGRIAYRVPTGLATDTVQLEVEDWSNPVLGNFKNLMIQVRPDFGTRLAKILTPRHRPQMATVRPGSFIPLPVDLNRKGTIEKIEVVAGKYPARVTEVLELPPPVPDLAGADVIISLGLGILKDKSGRPRDPREAYQYAEKLKATIEARHHSRAEIGATRALIYAEVKALEGLRSEDVV